MPKVESFREMLRRYATGERDFAGSELDVDPDNDMSTQALDGINLSRSWIVASFAKASLFRASFRFANVKTCDFREADLTGADFTNALIDAAQFQGATLTDTIFDGATYHSHVFAPGEKPKN